MDELELAEAVGKGAEFMDAIDAEWFWVIDLDRLDMRRVWSWTGGRCGCVLSQFSPKGLFHLNEFGLSLSDKEDIQMGFDLDANFYRYPSPGQWEALTALWVEEITDRRAAWFDAHPEYVIA